jgi:hypothetical protein
VPKVLPLNGESDPTLRTKQFVATAVKLFDDSGEEESIRRRRVDESRTIKAQTPKNIKVQTGSATNE